jgi:hypothetical protein
VAGEGKAKEDEEEAGEVGKGELNGSTIPNNGKSGQCENRDLFSRTGLSSHCSGTSNTNDL